jgi:hypothetical protein
MNADEALLLQSLITKIQKPNQRDIQLLQEWMKRPSMGNVYLLGRDSDIWASPEILDLVALNARHSEDFLSSWMADVAIHWYHHLVGWRFRVSRCSLQFG